MANNYWLIGQTIAIIVGIMSYIFKDLFHRNKSDIKQNTEETKKNTLAIHELKVEIKYLREAVALLPKLKQDIDSAHDKLRRVERSKYDQ